MSISWPALLLIAGMLLAIVLILVLPVPRSAKKTKASVDHKPARAAFHDDDRYWTGGIIYNNPDDPAMFVPKRFGLGWTVNFGNPRGRLVMFGILLLPLVVAILSILVTGGKPAGCHPSGCYPLP